MGTTLRDGFGEAGKEALEKMIQQKDDEHLAELAWRVIYLRQGDEFPTITEEQDREAHSHHPFLKLKEQAKAN